MATRPLDRAEPTLGVRARFFDSLGRFLDSDVCYSFRRSPVTMVAAVVTLLLFLRAVRAVAGAA